MWKCKTISVTTKLDIIMHTVQLRAQHSIVYLCSDRRPSIKSDHQQHEASVACYSSYNNSRHLLHAILPTTTRGICCMLFFLQLHEASVACYSSYNNTRHLLHAILPSTRDDHYHLRACRHNFTILSRSSSLLTVTLYIECYTRTWSIVSAVSNCCGIHKC